MRKIAVLHALPAHSVQFIARNPPKRLKLIALCVTLVHNFCMQTVENIITQAGLRPTKARLAVLKTIADAHSALSHPEILEQLAGQKEFDRVTVYRVLDWLTEHQLIHKISGDNRAWKFQLSQPRFQAVNQALSPSLMLHQHHHAHLHCKVCGQVTCIHELEPHFPQTALDLYQVESIDINIKGVCLQCAQEKTA